MAGTPKGPLQERKWSSVPGIARFQRALLFAVYESRSCAPNAIAAACPLYHHDRLRFGGAAENEYPSTLTLNLCRTSRPPVISRLTLSVIFGTFSAGRFAVQDAVRGCGLGTKQVLPQRHKQPIRGSLANAQRQPKRARWMRIVSTFFDILSYQGPPIYSRSAKIGAPMASSCCFP